MEKIVRKVTLTGIKPIMFDRFPGSIAKGQELKPLEKFNFGKDGKTIVIPEINIKSFLSSQNSESAAKRVIGRGWNSVAKAALSFVEISPEEIPLMKNGNVLTSDSKDIQIMHHVARVKKGSLVIPQPKERPVISLPWSVSFEITLFQNKDLSEKTLRLLFEEGGLCIGLGTFRGVFGKFEVTEWK